MHIKFWVENNFSEKIILLEHSQREIEDTLNPKAFSRGTEDRLDPPIPKFNKQDWASTPYHNRYISSFLTP